MTQLALTGVEDAAQKRSFDITLPSSQALLDKIGSDLVEADGIVIDSEFMLEVANDIAGRLMTVHDELNETRLKTTLPLRDAQAWVNDGYNPTLATIEKKVDAIKEQVKVWNAHVNELKRKAEAEARQRAEAERAESEQKLRDAQAEAERLLESATKEDDPDKAAALLEQAQQTAEIARAESAVVSKARPVAVATPARVKGVTGKWKARLIPTDPQAKAKLLLAAANRPELRGLFDVNESNLNALAAVQGEALSLPGVEIYFDESVRVGRKAV